MLKEKLWKENGSEVQVRTVLRTMSKRTGMFERTRVPAKTLIKKVLLTAWAAGASPRSGGGSFKGLPRFSGAFLEKIKPSAEADPRDRGAKTAGSGLAKGRCAGPADAGALQVFPRTHSAGPGPWPNTRR